MRLHLFIAECLVIRLLEEEEDIEHIEDVNEEENDNNSEQRETKLEGCHSN